MPFIDESANFKCCTFLGDMAKDGQRRGVKVKNNEDAISASTPTRSEWYSQSAKVFSGRLRF